MSPNSAPGGQLRHCTAPPVEELRNTFKTYLFWKHQVSSVVPVFYLFYFLKVVYAALNSYKSQTCNKQNISSPRGERSGAAATGNNQNTSLQFCGPGGGGHESGVCWEACADTCTPAHVHADAKQLRNTKVENQEGSELRANVEKDQRKLTAAAADTDVSILHMQLHAQPRPLAPRALAQRRAPQASSSRKT